MKAHKNTIDNTIISQNTQKSKLSLSLSLSRGLQAHRSRQAFTIVELLIVVVVIAILAAITIVAYNGITANAKDSALKSDLSTAAKKVGLVHAETGSYPTAKPSDLPGYIQYSQTNSGQGFCATASKEGKAFNITQTGTIQTGACAGHTIAGGGESLATMQSFTSSDCASLSVYTGSNAGAIVQLTDGRGGTARTYEVAKLADNKCWMLTNLKLGSTSSPTTLTPADSDVSSNQVIPQVVLGGSAPYDPSLSYDQPRVYGPVPGDDGSYGYLYNFSAATAGESLASLTTGDAQHSICPAGWRLPSAGVYGASDMIVTPGDFLDLDTAFGGSGYSEAEWDDNDNRIPTPQMIKWQPTGAFKTSRGGMKGTFSGPWYSGDFSGQGETGYYWSRTVYGLDRHSNRSASLLVSPYYYHTSGDIDRSAGSAIRCILK